MAGGCGPEKVSVSAGRDVVFMEEKRFRQGDFASLAAGVSG